MSEEESDLTSISDNLINDLLATKGDDAFKAGAKLPIYRIEEPFHGEMSNNSKLNAVTSIADQASRFLGLNIICSQSSTSLDNLYLHYPTMTFVRISSYGNSKISFSITPPVFSDCTCYGKKLDYPVSSDYALSFHRSLTASKGYIQGLDRYLARFCNGTSYRIGSVQSNNGVMVLASRLRTNVLMKLYTYLNSSTAIEIGDNVKDWWGEHGDYLESNDSCVEAARIMLEQFSGLLQPASVSLNTEIRSTHDKCTFSVTASLVNREDIVVDDDFFPKATATMARYFLLCSFKHKNVVVHSADDKCTLSFVYLDKQELPNVVANLYAILSMEGNEAISLAGYTLEKD